MAMKQTRIILLVVIFSSCLMCHVPAPLQAQESIQEMVDTAKDLMIVGKYADARILLDNAIALDPKLKPTLKPYLDRMRSSPKPSPKKAVEDPFTINQTRLVFGGIPKEQTVMVNSKVGEWEVESLEEWCKVMSVSKAFQEVEITCDQNFTGHERKCLVYFRNTIENGDTTDVALQIRQRSEQERLVVDNGYVWRDPEKPNYLLLKAKGDLVIVDLFCNTTWHVVHKPEDIEVYNDNGDMSKLVIKVEKYQRKFAGKMKDWFASTLGALERDYITIATDNQDVRLTIQVEKPKLGKSKSNKDK